MDHFHKMPMAQTSLFVAQVGSVVGAHRGTRKKPLITEMDLSVSGKVNPFFFVAKSWIGFKNDPAILEEYSSTLPITSYLGLALVFIMILLIQSNLMDYRAGFLPIF